MGVSQVTPECLFLVGVSQVFSAVGLDIMTRTRVEHLPETDKHKHKSINPLQDFLGATQDHASSTNVAIEAPPTVTLAQTKPLNTMEEYFTKPVDEEEYDGEKNEGRRGRGVEASKWVVLMGVSVCLSVCLSGVLLGIGRQPEVNTRVQKLKANVCLAEDFPMSLRDHIMPIIDLMVRYTLILRTPERTCCVLIPSLECGSS